MNREGFSFHQHSKISPCYQHRAKLTTSMRGLLPIDCEKAVQFSAWSASFLKPLFCQAYFDNRKANRKLGKTIIGFMKLTNNWQPYSIGLKLQRESWQMFGGLWSNKKKKRLTLLLCHWEKTSKTFPLKLPMRGFSLPADGVILRRHVK